MNKKILICGGGSTYTTGIVKSLLLEKEQLHFSEICLYDIEEDRQNKMSILVQAMMNMLGPEIKLTVTCDPQLAFIDADYILIQIRSGLLKMRAMDEKICIENGVIGQETVGPAGLSYGLRTIYPMLEIVEYAEKYAKKDYWIINYANPAAIVSKAVNQKYPHARIVNVCDMPIEILERFSEILECNLNELEGDYFGLNHFGWFTRVRRNGVDVTDELVQYSKTNGYLSKKKLNGGLLNDPDWLHTFECTKNIISVFDDCLPNTYMQYYYYPEESCKYMNKDNTRGMQVINDREKKVFDAAESYREGKEIDFNQFDVGIGADMLIDVMNSIENDLRKRMVVIVRNGGIIPNLAEDAMVEVPAYITAHGVEPIYVGDIPRYYKGLIEQQDACEGLVVEAAFEHSFKKFVMALHLSRIVPSLNKAELLARRLKEANEEYWPKLK